MRDQYLDTCKAILIFLVVLGHFLEQMIGWNEIHNHVVLGTIYFIHMPAFIFISGMLFKDKNYFKNMIFFIALLVPLQFAFLLFNSIWSGQLHFNWNVFERPYWILWYLMGMIVWTALTHFLIKTRISMFVAISLSLLVGLSPWNNYQYSVGRILVFLPFFVLGAVYGKSLTHWILQHKYVSSLGVIIVLAIASLVAVTQISRYWLYGSYSYAQLKSDWMEGSLVRIGCLLISCLGIYAIFGIAKLFNGHFIRLGIHTLPVYLLHGFVIIAIEKNLRLDFHITLNLTICVLLALLCSWILQQKIFDIVLRNLALWLMKPTEKLWKK